MILAGLGLAIAVLQHRRSDLAVLSFVAAYYYLISAPPVRFDRNLLPLLPFLAVLVGRAVGWLVDFMSAKLRPSAFEIGGATVRLRRVPSIAAGLL